MTSNRRIHFFGDPHPRPLSHEGRGETRSNRAIVGDRAGELEAGVSLGGDALDAQRGAALARGRCIA